MSRPTHTLKSPCDACPAAAPKSRSFAKPNGDYVVALAGNPNTGKSTVFNALTGLHQHTGNWPGKTVTRAEGYFTHAEKTFRIIDLPGTYSLLSTSTDEEVARDFILFGRPDVTVIVADASRLERNLNLVLQILEITDRAVICLNLVDEAEHRGIHIDANLLEKELGAPVVATIARRREGLDRLVEVAHEVAAGKRICTPRLMFPHTPRLASSMALLSEKLEALYPGLPNAHWVALRLLEGDPRMIAAARNGELESLARRAGPDSIYE